MSKYVWTEAMGEISGFATASALGRAYEECCREMVIAGVEWLDAHPDADPKFRSFPGVIGVCAEQNDDAKALSKAICAPGARGGGATGAMHQAAVTSVLWIKAHGWAAYVADGDRMSEDGARPRWLTVVEARALGVNVLADGRSDPGHPGYIRSKIVISLPPKGGKRMWFERVWFEDDVLSMLK